MKKFLCAILLLSIIISLSACYSIKIETENIDEYIEILAKVNYAKEYMPSIEQCGQYSTVLATYKQTAEFFVTDTVGLFLSYDDGEYHKQVESIGCNYEFFRAEDDDLVSDHDAVVDGYNIQLVKQEYPYETYKTGLLIGLDDTNHKICYLFYFDVDLDVLDDLTGYIETFFNMP